MGRKKWNRLTTDKKKKVHNRMMVLMDKLTDIEDKYDKIYDLEEAINDNIKDLFECDLECVTCTELDRAKCMQNFRSANTFMLQKLKTYEDMFADIINYLVEVVQKIHTVFVEQEDIEDEEDQKSDAENKDDVSMFS